MKKRIVKILLSVMTATVLVGCNSIAVGDTEEIKQAAITQARSLYNGTEVHYTNSIDDFNALTPILENRNGRIIIEITQGIVLDADGNGEDICGNYIHYDMSRFSVGDKVESVFVYNPETNAVDDILYRVDTLAE